MEEKKLTDEEVIKALECCAVEPCEDCGNCPRFTKEKLCHKANAKQSLDLIHRLQGENKRLKDELKIKTCPNTDYCGGRIQQAVKDTAKEIYAEATDCVLIIRTQEYGKIEVVSLERLQEIVKRKGVEVE